MGRTLRFLGLGLLCLTSLSTTAAGLPRPAVDFPLPVDSYHDQQIPSLLEKLTGRIQREPLNLVATIIFFGAIVHTFLAGWFLKIAHSYQQSYDAIEYLLEAKDGQGCPQPFRMVGMGEPKSPKRSKKKAKPKNGNGGSRNGASDSASD